MKLLKRLLAPFRRRNPNLSRVEWEVVSELRKGPRPAKKIIDRVKASRRTIFQVLRLLRERGIITKRGEIYELGRYLEVKVDELMWVFSLLFMLGAAATENVPLAVFSGLVFLVSWLRTRLR